MNIKIGPIYFEWKIIDKLFSETNERLDGHIRYGECEIWTDKGLSAQRETQVLWHEALHGISDIYGGELTEKQVETISNGVMDIIRHNKWLVERTQK